MDLQDPCTSLLVDCLQIVIFPILFYLMAIERGFLLKPSHNDMY